MDKELMRDVERFVEENYDAIFRDIGRLVAVNSVMGEAAPGAPFGPGPAKALELALDMAREMGLEAVNCQNMLGYAQVGQGDEYLATVTHLDVVPAGEGWSGDPFVMHEREGYIIGRGVMDDKGPSVLCLYALKYLKERCGQLRYPVRALLGINEENGMGDVEYYLKNYPAPVFCFSPDAGFPLCNGEKGIFQGRLISTLPLGKVRDIKGGMAANAVPDKAEAWVEAESLSSTAEVEAVLEQGLWHLTARGIGGHASKPENTKNAIGILVKYILDNKLTEGEELKFFTLLHDLHRSYDGEGLGIASDDGNFEPLTVIGGMIGVEDGHIFQWVDSRYPTSTSAEEIATVIRECSAGLAMLEPGHVAVPFYMALDNPAVKACMDVYNTVTGEQAQPYTMGGGTYARDFPNGVSFGPEHPERPHPDFAGDIHAVDEAASKEDFAEALKIYILALLELEKLDY